MGFIILLILSTLSIAGSAAYFSVYGLAKVFSGSFLPVILMASALEGGKLITASLLYRYWYKMTKVMKGYLISAVFVLMLITSMGIFGYLSASYEDNVAPFEQHNEQISLLESQKTEAEHLKEERLARQEEINKQIANLPNNMVNGRRTLIASNKEELDQITKDVAQYTTEIRDYVSQISKLKSETIQQTAHVGPIIFIAQAFHADINQATKWLIFLIIFVFDPLAVILTVATNMVLADRKQLKQETKESKIEQPTPLSPVEINKVELSDPPIYSADKRCIQSKDGMTWHLVAPWMPNQTVPGPFVSPSQLPQLSEQPITVLPTKDPSPIKEPPSIIMTAFEVFTKPNLSPQEKRMKEELESLLKRHQEVLDMNQSKSKKT